MIRFSCEHCGAKFKVDSAMAGKRGRCPKCQGVIAIPALEEEASDVSLEALAAMEASTAPTATPTPRPAAGAAVAAGGPTCACCGQPLAAGAVICVNCGIKLPSGRPVMTAHEPDLDMLYYRAEQVVRPLSWLLGAGLYPLYSEANRKTRPIVAWAIIGLTIVISLSFLGLQIADSPKMRTMKNWMLWDDDAVVDSNHIAVMFEHTSFGDIQAYYRAAGEVAQDPSAKEGLSEEAFMLAAYDRLTPEEKPLGEYRTSQLITHV